MAFQLPPPSPQPPSNPSNRCTEAFLSCNPDQCSLAFGGLLTQVPGRNWKIAKLPRSQAPGSKSWIKQSGFAAGCPLPAPKKGPFFKENHEPPKWASILVALRKISKTFAGGLWGGGSPSVLALVDFDQGVADAMEQLPILQSNPKTIQNANALHASFNQTVSIL